jgi:cation diffusion facilitator CzcD-associated flavoprotein CzcO
MSKTIETVIIGGGQAGLAMSYCLQERGMEHTRAGGTARQCMAKWTLGFIYARHAQLDGSNAWSRLPGR